MWKESGLLINKISIPSEIKIRKSRLFEPSIIEVPIMLKISAYEYLDQFNKECVNGEVDEIDIVFISDFDDITFFYYMDQPKSML